MSLADETRNGSPDPPADAVDGAIIAAARDEFVRYGIRRANMEEIGRRAGVSRVTVYRRFTSKSHLLRALVMADIADFVERFDRVWCADAPVQERITNATVLTIQEVRRHPLLTTVTRSEPAALFSVLTVDGAEEFELIRGLLATRIQGPMDRGEIPAIDAGQAAETLLRLVYTIVLMPFGLVPGRTEPEVRAWARTYVVPILLGSRADGS